MSLIGQAVSSNRSGKVIDYKIAVPRCQFSPSDFIASEFQEYNIDNLYESILRLHLIKTRTYVCHGITARALLLANGYTTHLLSSTRATNEGNVVLEVWSIFPFAIKRIFPCSFANKRMRLLTRVYGISGGCGMCNRAVEHNVAAFSELSFAIRWQGRLALQIQC